MNGLREEKNLLQDKKKEKNFYIVDKTEIDKYKIVIDNRKSLSLKYTERKIVLFIKVENYQNEYY